MNRRAQMTPGVPDGHADRGHHADRMLQDVRAGSPERWRGAAGRQVRRRTPVVLAALLVVSLLAACGGGDSNDSDPTDTSTIRNPAGAAGTASPAASPTTRSAATPTTRAASTPTGIPNPIPEATQGPMPTPRPAIGATVQAEGWALTVTSIDLFESVGDSDAEGVFLYVRMAISNSGSAPAAFPFTGLVVIDINGESYFLSEAATAETLQYDYGITLDQQLNPGDLRNVAAVFDIPTDATGLTLTTPSRVFEVRLEYNAPK